MRVLILIILLIMVFPIVGQDLTADFNLIKAEVLQEEEIEEEQQSFFKGMLKIYSNHISEQIINDCIYEQSCSEFGQGALRAFGPLKGTMLTMDRMMRCNRLSQSGTMPVRFNEIGKISDHWHRYGKKK